MTTAPNEPTHCIVLRDATGGHFLVPVAVVEACRVPESMVLEVLAALARDTKDDTDGYAGGSNAGGYVPMGFAAMVLGPLIGTAIGAAIGGYANDGDESAAAQLKKQAGMSDMSAGGIRMERRRWP